MASHLLIAPLEALTDSRLTDPERRVILALYSFRGKSTDNNVWPSIQSIALRANVNDQTWVSKLTKGLEKKGWLTKKRRGFTGGNIYSLTIPAAANNQLSNLDPQPNLGPQSNLDPDALSKLDGEPKSNLDPQPKYKEQTNEQTSEQLKTMSDKPDRVDYKSMFSELWDSWPTGFGEKGSRKNAESAFMKLKPDRPFFDESLELISSQAADKRNKKTHGQFAAPFQHVERWIKNRRWEDEIEHTRPEPARVSATQSALGEYLSSKHEGNLVDIDGSCEYAPAEPEYRGRIPILGKRIG